MGMIVPWINLVSDIVAILGGLVIMIGVVSSLFSLLRIELRRAPDSLENDRLALRHHFGYYILLGLEFLIAADVLRTLIHPGMEELVALGVVVLIRTVISVSLNWELSRISKVEDHHP